jgi:transposase
MSRPLSQNLRERLISAVEGGMLRRLAAPHCVAASMAIKWVDRWCRLGHVEPVLKVATSVRIGSKAMLGRFEHDQP